MPTSTIVLIGQILTQAEHFLAGNPITLTIPTEVVDLGGFKVDVAGTLTIKKA